MTETLTQMLAKRAAFEDDRAETKIAKARERIRANFPDARAPLTWRRDSATRMVSTCGRFSVEKHGDGEAARYTAKTGLTVIGHRRYTAEQAKDDCCRHVSPLPLEPEKPAQADILTEREPGSDDE